MLASYCWTMMHMIGFVRCLVEGSKEEGSLWCGSMSQLFWNVIRCLNLRMVFFLAF